MTTSYKTIAFFSHKGGVSKTTTTYNLGWALANAGKRVLMIDGDPQCNLTGMTLSLAGQEDFDGRLFSRIEADTIVAGSISRAHPTTLLMDPETLLLHQIVEDTPPDFVGLNRRITTLHPSADLEVDGSRFSFAVPS